MPTQLPTQILEIVNQMREIITTTTMDGENNVSTRALVTTAVTEALTVHLDAGEIQSFDVVCNTTNNYGESMSAGLIAVDAAIKLPADDVIYNIPLSISIQTS